MLNNFANLSQLQPAQHITPPAVEKQAKEKARDRCFAIVNTLKSRLSDNGLTDAAVWQWVKSTHGVESRKELSEKDWVILGARLDAAEKDNLLFNVLCDNVKAENGTCRAYRIHADGTFKKVYDGVIPKDISERCQRHADASGCDVRLHGADGSDGVQLFNPVEYASDPTEPPTAEPDENKPAKIFEVRVKGRETRYAFIEFPNTNDLSGWCQRHADASGYDVIVTDRMGHKTLMTFSATPAQAPTPAQPVIVNNANDVIVDGVKWVILNAWQDKWHFVKLDKTMESHIATGETRKEAVTSLLNYIGGAV